MLNFVKKLAVVQSIAPVNVTTNVATYGTPVALAYSTSNVFVFDIGTVGGTFTPKLQQSVNGGTAWTDVSATDMDTTLVAVTASNDPKLQEVTYTGTAGLLRPVVTVSGVSSGGVFSAYAVLGNTRNFGHIGSVPVPIISSAVVGETGSTIDVVFSQTMASTDWEAGWSATADAAPLTITDAVLDGTTLTLTISETVTDDQEVIVSYTPYTGFYRHGPYYLGTSSITASSASTQMVVPKGALTLAGRVPTFVHTTSENEQPGKATLTLSGKVPTVA